MNTTEVRSEALESFVTCFNLCYPDWEIAGDASRELTANEVEFSYTTKNLARCGPRKNGRAYFAINSSWYEDASAGERVGLLIHELAHIKHTDHSPAFWEQVVRNYRALQSNVATVEDVVLGNLTWDGVEEFIVNNPLTSMVDNRREIAYERRQKLAEAIGYPTEQLKPFSNMNIYVQHSKKNTVQAAPLYEVEFEQSDPDEVAAYFHERPREYLKKDGSKHVIQPLPAEQTANGYELLDGHRMASLADYAGLRRVYVELSEASQTAGTEGRRSGRAN
ncbi:hypothetical protein [Halorussus sp. AFM4]|uniref:hypothetical protein n=1 Tax=Halorussus sp. AFM4 TaxID=3421651 RepID=UPI003EBE8E45